MDKLSGVGEKLGSRAEEGSVFPGEKGDCSNWVVRNVLGMSVAGGSGGIGKINSSVSKYE